MSAVPDLRIARANSAEPRPDRDYVLYWMIANRRPGWNFSLQRAVEWAKALNRPLVVLEALRVGYRWASDRLHGFVLDGMRDNQRALDRDGVYYYPYVEPEPGEGAGLLEALAARAAVVVTDDFPCFFLPRMVAAAAPRLDCILEMVDSNGLLPLRATDQTFPTAYAFRRFLQRELPAHLPETPKANPLARVKLPATKAPGREILKRWRPATAARLDGGASALADLPIDHGVARTELGGGAGAGATRIERFLDKVLYRYPDERNQPEQEAASGLSPYLHFGHVSAHQVFAQLARREDWTPDRVAKRKDGKRAGWWNMSVAAEAFLDELVTWREVGYNFSHHRGDDYDRYESLPEWARVTLGEHESDPRDPVYDLATFEAARTHDELWNAAQNELRRAGRIHNYLRMLWGKKILEWSETPRSALDIMIELNNKYALDGRNPNSYSGIMWVLGRFDRAWGPVRPIFGKIRYMSSANTRRKVRVGEYVRHWNGEATRLDR